MSYRDHYAGSVLGVHPHEVTHSWADFTRARLSFLYGEDHFIARRPDTQRDIAAWRKLGSRKTQPSAAIPDIHSPSTGGEARIGGDSAA